MFPYTYKKVYNQPISDKNEFVSNLKKISKDINDLKIKNNIITFTTNKALIPFNYDVEIRFLPNNKIEYEINLTNLFLIDLIISLLILFVIKDLIILLLVVLGIFVITYLINILHINTVFEYWFDEILTENKIICPYCKKRIPKGSTVCPYCGRDLTVSTTQDIEVRYVVEKE